MSGFYIYFISLQIQDRQEQMVLPEAPILDILNGFSNKAVKTLLCGFLQEVQYADIFIVCSIHTLNTVVSNYGFLFLIALKATLSG